MDDRNALNRKCILLLMSGFTPRMEPLPPVYECVLILVDYCMIFFNMDSWKIRQRAERDPNKNQIKTKHLERFDQKIKWFES